MVANKPGPNACQLAPLTSRALLIKDPIHQSHIPLTLGAEPKGEEELAVEQTWQHRPISFAYQVGVKPIQAWVQDARKQIVQYKRGTLCCMNSFLGIVKGLSGQTLLGLRTMTDPMKGNASFDFYEIHG